MKIFLLVGLILMQSRAALASPCLDRYKEDLPRYEQEVALLEEVNRNFSEKNIIETGRIITTTKLTHLVNMNRFFRRYVEAYCPIKRAADTCEVGYHEMMILLAELAKNGSFCAGGTLYSLDDIMTSFFLLPSGVSLLDEFKAFAAKDGLDVPEFYPVSDNGLNINPSTKYKSEIENLLNFFDRGTRGVYQAFLVGKTIYHLPVLGLQGSMLAMMIDAELDGTIKNDLGNAFVLMPPDGISESEFQLGFRSVFDALSSNEKQSCSGSMQKVVDYLQLRNVCLPPSDEIERRENEVLKSIGRFYFSDEFEFDRVGPGWVLKALDKIDALTIHSNFFSRLICSTERILSSDNFKSRMKDVNADTVEKIRLLDLKVRALSKSLHLSMRIYQEQEEKSGPERDEQTNRAG